jgi:uncharacterized protein YndB with AHSA1/START domain
LLFAMRWERTAEATSPTPPDRVWDVLLDGRRWFEWNHGVQWMTVEGELAAGSLLTMKPRRAPQTAFRIEAAVPGQLLAIVIGFGPLAQLRFRYVLSPRGEGTQIAKTISISGPLASVLLRRRAERIAAAMPANLARLAERAAIRAGTKRDAAVADRADVDE